MSGAQHDINSSEANILIFWAMYGGPAWSSLSHPEAAGLIRSLCTEQWPHRMMSCRWVRGICEGVRFGVRTCSVSLCCWNFSFHLLVLAPVMMLVHTKLLLIIINMYPLCISLLFVCVVSTWGAWNSGVWEKPADECWCGVCLTSIKTLLLKHLCDD